MEQRQDAVWLITKTAVLLHNLVRIHCPTTDKEVDHENENHDVIPKAWQAQSQLLEVRHHARCNRDHFVTKMQFEYLWEYFNSPARTGTWHYRLAGVNALVSL